MEYFLKFEVEGEFDIIFFFFNEIYENIDKFENSVKISFKYLVKEDDKECWSCFFNIMMLMVSRLLIVIKMI